MFRSSEKVPERKRKNLSATLLNTVSEILFAEQQVWR